MKKVFIIDDEPEILASLAMIFTVAGMEAVTASSGREAMEKFSIDPVPVTICDNALPDIRGLELLSELRGILPDVQMIMFTGKGTIDIAVAAMKAGMYDFVTKPVEPERIIHLARKAHELYDALSANRALRAEVLTVSDEDYVGKSSSVHKLKRMVHAVAPTDSTVLIEGESGTGKELVARMIHKYSERRRGPFVAVDCGAIPEGLVESELFGHEKGAFTGAYAMKEGKFERASHGTLFLDEISNLPMAAQAKLLRALQERVIERVGGTRSVPVDIRLIAATNSDLQDEVAARNFREDLYYRLNIVKLRLPPLRERKSDIMMLADHFIEKHRERARSDVRGISKEALRAMMEYSWPGNVRELENAIEHAMILATTPEIMPHDLPMASETAPGAPSREEASGSIKDAEKKMLVETLRQHGGNKIQTAKALGIQRSSLYSKLRKHGLM